MQKYKPPCKEEQDFLRDYNPNQFPPVAVTVDAVIFGIEKDNTDNYRKMKRYVRTHIGKKCCLHRSDAPENVVSVQIRHWD